LKFNIESFFIKKVSFFICQEFFCGVIMDESELRSFLKTGKDFKIWSTDIPNLEIVGSASTSEDPGIVFLRYTPEPNNVVNLSTRSSRDDLVKVLNSDDITHHLEKIERLNFESVSYFIEAGLENKPCFFCNCTDPTLDGCINKEPKLFGARKQVKRYLEPVKIGDIGFLLNVSNNQMFGIFKAATKVAEVDPDRWNPSQSPYRNGDFPVQIGVESIGEIKVVENSDKELEKVLELITLAKGTPNSYRIPKYNYYKDPEITRKIIQIFSEKGRSYTPKKKNLPDIIDI
jgi:hypothetical protein